LNLSHYQTCIIRTYTTDGNILFGHKTLLDISYLDTDHCYTYLNILDMNYTTVGYGLLDSSHYWTYGT